MVGHRPVRHVPAEDLSELVLIGPGDVGLGRLVVELDALVLRAPDHLLLARDRQGFPRVGVVAPLLQQEDRAARARDAVGNHRELGRFDQTRVLAAVDEAGQVAVVSVRPARGLLGDGRRRFERPNRFTGHVEDDVVGAPGDPEHGVVLGRRHRVAARTDDVTVEALELPWCFLGHEFAPELGAEADDEVDAADRRSRLAQRSDGAHELRRRFWAPSVELEVGVRRRPKREQSALRRTHPAIMNRSAVTVQDFPDISATNGGWL